MKRFECSLKHAGRERAGSYSIDQVLPFIVDSKHSEGALRVYDGHEVKMWSIRYHTFKKSLSCISCGITGQYFALEKAIEDIANRTNRFHFNLYAKLDNGEEVLMTKDHIQPKSLGGRNHIDNMQTMCKVCNEMKMNRVEENKNENHILSR